MRHVGKVISEMVEPRPAAVEVVFEMSPSSSLPKFRVSTQAMRIRLENLGLLRISTMPVEQDRSRDRSQDPDFFEE